MSKEFCKMGLGLVLGLGTCLGGLGLASGARAQCTVPPSCESLGYTMVADNCNGKKTLKCPFDTSKLYCVTEAGLANVNLGDIVFSDHSTSSPLVYVNKTPIGIVIGKTADSIIVAQATQRSFGNRSYSNDRLVDFTVNKENSDIGEISVPSWEGSYLNNVFPSKEMDEIKNALATYDAKRLYSFFINNFFSERTGTNTLDEFGLKEFGSNCGSGFCPPILLPSEITVKWTRSVHNDYGYTLCNQLQTEGTSQGDWYLPITKDIMNFGEAMTNLRNHAYSLSYNLELLSTLKVGDIFLIDKAIIAPGISNLTLFYTKKGSGDGMRGSFIYEYPTNVIRNNGSNQMICITKIKM